MTETALSATGRTDTLARLAAETFDVLIIGGGITGAGIARDAALRGLSVALIEADDFAVGTSSRSSKLIHGGLRYLAMGDVALVRETALERKAVHRLAPHLAEPYWMLVPAKSRMSLLKFRTGITAYEKLGAVAEADLHRNWSGEELAYHEPKLDQRRHPHACAYREYLTDDARLVLATLRAAAGAGAVVASRLEAVALLREGSQQDSKVVGVRARCALEGSEPEIRARVVVNAAGPWADRVAGLEAEREGSRLHLSKGVHIVLPADRLPVRNLVVMTAEDKRSIFAIPRGDTVYLGTTDTTYQGEDWRWPEIDAEDVRYLLEPVNRYFDVPDLTVDDVTAAWSGLRPLIAEPGKQAKEMSRKDEIWIGAGGMVTIAGGKLTGFRKMAEDIMVKVGEQLGRSLPPPPELQPLPGGDFAGDLEHLARSLPGMGNLGRACADRLVRLYGTEARDVLAAGAEPLVRKGEVILGEVDWAVNVEAAYSLEDLIYRRTRAAWYSPAEREALLAPAAARMAELLGWDAAERSRQIEQVRQRYRQEMSFQH
ncbi:MAG: glycerol-3-phosphate dehydrogenase/oxidase [Gammaproteobacteria bacterium]|nr:glycerol-3-phosphate dehydrogenase/oxidase [Gammaproteobacteria bacterium]